jgi:hypothetical protein
MAAAVEGSTADNRCYNDRLMAAHHQLSQQLYGQSPVANPPPMRHTGELFGIEYLYSQTGHSFELFKPDADDVDVAQETDDMQDEDLTQDDEGFDEVVDLTVGLDFDEPAPVDSGPSTADILAPVAAGSPHSATSSTGDAGNVSHLSPSFHALASVNCINHRLTSAQV